MRKRKKKENKERGSKKENKERGDMVEWGRGEREGSDRIERGREGGREWKEQNREE